MSNAECNDPLVAIDDEDVCIESACFLDRENQTVSQDYGSEADDAECAIIGGTYDAPFYIEVVDTGLNDFDVDHPYNVTLTLDCGCPEICDGNPNGDFCQDGVVP